MARRPLQSLALALLGVVAAAVPAHAEPSWLAPEGLSAAVDASSPPRVAFDRHGTAVAVWSLDAGDDVVQAATRRAGGQWSAPETLSRAGDVARDPQVVVDDAGDALVVWRVAPNGVQAAERPAGGAWTGTFDVAPDTSSGGSGRVTLFGPPRLAVDPAGNAIALWPAGGGIKAAVRPAAGGWSAPADLSTSAGAAGPAVAFAATGEAVAVWTEPGGKAAIEAATWRPQVGWSAPVTLSDPAADARFPHVAVDPSGDAIAVWTRMESGASVVMSARRPAGGSWRAPDAVSAPGEGGYEPEVALGPSGEAMAVWRRADNVLRFATAGRGASFGTPRNLSPPDGLNTSPSVLIDALGTTFAAWERQAGGSTRVHATVRPPGGDFGLPIPLSDPARPGQVPDLAADGQGNAVVAWRHGPADDAIVQAAGYDGVAPELRGLEVPGLASTDSPAAVSADPYDVWGPVSLAWDFGDGATGAGTRAAHDYRSAGGYEVTATATDAAGNATSARRAVAVSTSPVAAPDVRGVDTLAPGGRVAIRRQRLRTVLARGLRVTVSCSEACAIDAQLRLGRVGAAAGRQPIAGRGSARLGRAGRATVVVKLRRRAIVRLRRARWARLTLLTRVEDAAGNARTVRTRATLRR